MLCHGEFVAILNSDDTWHEEKLQKQASYMEDHPKCGAVFTHAKLIDERGITWNEGSNSLQLVFQPANRDRYGWLRHFFLRGNVFCTSSAMIRRECLDRVGLLDGRYVQLQDFDMWLRMAIAGYDLHVLEEQLTNYRAMRNNSNLSAPTIAARSIYLFEFARILRNFWNIKTLSELQSIFPEMTISVEADDSLVLFYLAHHAAAQWTIPHQLFAIETMSRWGGDMHSMSLAHKCHGFGGVEYRNFLSHKRFRDLLRRKGRALLSVMLNSVVPLHLRQVLKASLVRRKR
jgi:hypothetical protein